jgi:hypothetical protein
VIAQSYPKHPHIPSNRATVKPAIKEASGGLLDLVQQNGSRSGVAVRNGRPALGVDEPAHQRADENKRQKRKNAHQSMLLHDRWNLYPPLDAGVERDRVAR